jgi:phosphatidylserine/phosphatidylglycerophosphate/cardiolipin synthase-like enzyme
MGKLKKSILKLVEAVSQDSPDLLIDIIKAIASEQEISEDQILQKLSLSYALHYFSLEVLRAARNSEVTPETLSYLIEMASFVHREKEKKETKISPVWTGPSFSSSPIKNKTFETVKSMFLAAEKEIVIVGYTFSLENTVVNSLVIELINASKRGCRINIIFHANSTNKKRILESWPKDVRLPQLYYWQDKKREGFTTSLHSKLICVDQKQLLVTSANFTLNGLERNIETGILIQDDESVRQIWEQFRSLLSEKEIIKV